MPPVCGYGSAISFTGTRLLMNTYAHSCPDKEDRSSSGWRQDENKVQDQVLALSVHTITR